jgi:hypothetical protein
LPSYSPVGISNGAGGVEAISSRKPPEIPGAVAVGAYTVKKLLEP